MSSEENALWKKIITFKFDDGYHSHSDSGHSGCSGCSSSGCGGCGSD